MHFGVQNFDRQAVLDEAASLTQLTDATLLGMTGDERATSVNFEVETIDQYTFEAIEGDALTLTTTTPASGSGEFSNPLSPRISLFHDAGGSTAVALGTDAGDGRNEQISHTVPVGAGGTYRVVVSDGTDPGTYTLSIDGATGATPPLAVTDFSPAEGILLTSFPAGYQIDLSGNVLFTTIDADDLQITPPGGAATAPQNVTIVDGDTLAFDIANIAGADGTYGVQIAAGAFGGANGQPITEFTATYRVDATTPKVDSVIVNGTTGAGAVPNAGPTTIDIAFSEEIDSADLGPEDVSLQNTLISMGHIADTFTYDAPSSTLSLTFNDLPEGDYTLTLASGATAFRDLVGNLLDGNGDGTGGDDFTAAYTSDISVLPLPTPLEVVAPLGALVYDPPVTGLFQTAGDTDTFTIDLDAGDLASLAVTGAQGDALDMALLDADGSTLLALGLDALNVTSVIDGFIADAAGTYFARVSGTAGSDYNLVVTRNAQFERERNDTSQTAQDLVLRSGSTGQVLGGRQLSALQIEPDLFPPGTDLANAFGGATLAIVQFDGTTPAGFQVTSLTSSIASTGSHIFGSTSFNSTRRLRVACASISTSWFRSRRST